MGIGNPGLDCAVSLAGAAERQPLSAKVAVTPRNWRRSIFMVQVPNQGFVSGAGATGWLLRKF